MRILQIAALIASTAIGSAAAQATTVALGAHVFTIQLPPGYKLTDAASPASYFKTFGFTPAPHPDGNRALIQVSLIDLAAGATSGGGAEPTLREFVSGMVGAVHQRRADWHQAERPVMVAGVAGTRVDWTGSNGPSPERSPQQPASAMHGTFFLAIRDHIGIVLHTQDVDAFWPKTGPAAERALGTFAPKAADRR